MADTPTSLNAASLIKLSAISRTFYLGDSEVHALRNVELNIAPGEYIAVMGPSGSGKSTLLNLIGLLDRPDVGTYTLEGRDVTTLKPDEQALLRSERIGFIFQSFHLVPRLTAAANVELPLMLAGVPAAERAQRVAQALNAFGLTDRAKHQPNQLSGGQRQRVAIARATVQRPAVLLADEPTGNLDRVTGVEVLRLLEALNADGMTLIIVTHDHDLGARAGRQILMEDGRIVSDIRREAAVADSSAIKPVN
jgi:putative ABC transport system ATP-binding protein